MTNGANREIGPIYRLGDMRTREYVRSGLRDALLVNSIDPA